MLDSFLNYLVVFCVLGAGVLSVSAGVGLLRFRDPLSRLHAATKPQIFGLLLMLLAVAIDQRSWVVFFTVFPVFILQSLTAPVSAHMAGRAAYRAGHIDRENLASDDLEAVIISANTQVFDPYLTDVSAEESASLNDATQKR